MLFNFLKQHFLQTREWTALTSCHKKYLRKTQQSDLWEANSIKRIQGQPSKTRERQMKKKKEREHWKHNPISRI